MLIATPIGCAPTLLAGFGAVATASDPIKRLQIALTNLSTATRNPGINPGSTSGMLVNGLPDDRTMAAVAASLALVNRKLPTWAAVALSIGFGLGATSDKAKQAVLANASELQKAAILATIAAPYYMPTEAAPETPTKPDVYAITGPWYKTWWGIGAMAIGAIGFISLIAARRSA